MEDLKGSRRVLILRYIGIRLEGLKKTTKNLSQNSRNLNPGPPKCESGLLTSQPRRLLPRMNKATPSLG
jgi:hypothetical protein